MKEDDILSEMMGCEDGKAIYEYTKQILDKYNLALSPKSKSIIFNKYIKLWENKNFKLSILDTEYKDKYKDADFGKDGRFNSDPMVAGFNLSNSELTFEADELLFLSVNFQNTKFNNVNCTKSHFEDCDFSELVLSEQTWLLESTFANCSLKNIKILDDQKEVTKDTEKISKIFDKSRFSCCDLTGSDIKKLDIVACTYDEGNSFTFKNSNGKELDDFNKEEIFRSISNRYKNNRPLLVEKVLANYTKPVIELPPTLVPTNTVKKRSLDSLRDSLSDFMGNNNKEKGQRLRALSINK